MRRKRVEGSNLGRSKRRGGRRRNQEKEAKLASTHQDVH